MLEPFGVSNPVPSFVLRDVTVAEVQPISFGKHTKLLLERPDGYPLTAMYFSHSPKETDVYAGDRIDILAGLDINEFGGKRTAQLILRDLRLTAEAEAAAEESAARYAALRAGAPSWIDPLFSLLVAAWLFVIFCLYSSSKIYKSSRFAS